MTNELFELARRRRSCRRYSGEKIPDEIINENELFPVNATNIAVNKVAR